MREFAEWDSFYLIIGGAAGALIGLQFVVLTLIAERSSRAATEAGRAFSTPTVLHFSVVLFLSAFIRVPWPSITPPTIIGAVVGATGAVYVLKVVRELAEAAEVRREKKLRELRHQGEEREACAVDPPRDAAVQEPLIDGVVIRDDDPCIANVSVAAHRHEAVGRR